MRDRRRTEAGPTAARSDRDGMLPPRIVLQPGPEYGTRGRLWQGIPGIERAHGTANAAGILLAAFTEEDVLAGRPPRNPRLRRTVGALPRA